MGTGMERVKEDRAFKRSASPDCSAPIRKRARMAPSPSVPKPGQARCSPKLASASSEKPRRRRQFNSGSEGLELVKRRVRWSLFKMNLQVFRTEPCPFCNAGKHARTDLLSIVEREYKIGPAGTGKYTVRTGLSFDDPANAEECSQNTSGTRARPLAHAAAKEIVKRSGSASPCSRRSARTRRARA